MKSFFRYHFWVIAWALIIFIQSSFPAIEIPKVEWISMDKVIHMGVFGLLVMLCYISFINLKHQNTFKSSPLLWSAVLTIIYGASDEIHQYFVPNRSSEVLDWMADILGIIIMLLLIKYYLSKKFNFFKISSNVETAV
ncbi:MAG: VanZ family protein [Ignavibacteria bacterium]|nr:VanZ family protein [Ignavibacteria bacterium]